MRPAVDDRVAGPKAGLAAFVNLLLRDLPHQPLQQVFPRRRNPEFAEGGLVVLEIVAGYVLLPDPLHALGNFGVPVVGGKTRSFEDTAAHLAPGDIREVAGSLLIDEADAGTERAPRHIQSRPGQAEEHHGPGHEPGLPALGRPHQASGRHQAGQKETVVSPRPTYRSSAGDQAGQQQRTQTATVEVHRAVLHQREDCGHTGKAQVRAGKSPYQQTRCMPRSNA